jgi:hypothetical protein
MATKYEIEQLDSTSIDACLQYLSDEPCRIVRRVGDSGGGMYVIGKLLILL